VNLGDRNSDTVSSIEALRHPVSPGISPINDDTHQGEFENLETSLTQTHTSTLHRVDVERDSDEDVVIFQGRS
jgi:hypothetical protein